MAEALVETFKPVVGKPHPITELVLIPSGGGRFEVTIDGELVYSKAATNQHTTNPYIIEQVRARL
jgi:selenoprotein W-related protein